VRLLRVLLSVAAVAVGSWAQTTDNPLTNSEIESMLVAGLPESTILLKIQTAAFRGLVDVEASSTALIALKQRGASEQVLNAVMWAEPFGTGLKRKQEEGRAVPGLPGSAGVYYRAASGWVTLGESFLLWPPFYSVRSLYSRRSHQYNVPLEGSHADLQIAEPQPAFCLREPASHAWRIIRLASRDDQRLLRFVSSGEFAATDWSMAIEARAIHITRVGGEVFTLRPAAPLEAGEYVLCAAVPGGPDLNACYSFGIQR
jgi:hypothetical protein